MVVARLDNLRPSAPVLDVDVLVEALVADGALRREVVTVLVLGGLLHEAEALADTGTNI